MNLQIVSASGNTLETPDFLSISVMTEMGEITILPGHEPLLAAIRPGIISLKYLHEGKEKHDEFVSGWGVINISPESCVIVADVIENGDTLTDMEYIEKQKKEAEALVKAYQEENGKDIDPKRLIELEYELLKYTAMHHLGQKYQYENTTGARR